MHDPEKKLWQQARVRTLRKNKRVSIKTKEHSHTEGTRDQKSNRKQQQQQPSNSEQYKIYMKMCKKKISENAVYKLWNIIHQSGLGFCNNSQFPYGTGIRINRIIVL